MAVNKTKAKTQNVRAKKSATTKYRYTYKSFENFFVKFFCNAFHIIVKLK